MLTEATGTTATDVALYDAPSGGQSVCVFIKRTYDMVNAARMHRSARGEIPLFAEPVEEDDDGREPVPCLTHECDLAPRKPCTDIVVHGRVRSPGALPVASMTAGVRVGALTKHITVVGDRRVAWRPGARIAFERPEPFVEIPLSWRRAYGGIDGSLEVPEPTNIGELLSALTPEEHPGAYPRNPAGRAWIVNPDERSLAGCLLPNFEDPDYPLSPDRMIFWERERWWSAPIPAGFGWVGQGWFPRAPMLGIGPELPEQLRSGWLTDPPELDDGPDPRFFSGASRGMRAVGLRGDELVELHGFHHEGPLTTALPSERPDVLVAFDRQPLETAIRLHTIELFADYGAASLLWVAEARPPQQLPRRLPLNNFDGYDPLEGIDVIVDGVALSRDQPQ